MLKIIKMSSQLRYLLLRNQINFFNSCSGTFETRMADKVRIEIDDKLIKISSNNIYSL